MNKYKKAAEQDLSCYSDFEVSLIRQQLKVGNAEARRVFSEEKYPINPEIEAAQKKRA